MKGAWEIIVVALVGVTALAAILSVPVWKQNRYGKIMRERVKLERTLEQVSDSCLVLDREIAALSSRARLEVVAADMGLTYADPPTKVSGGGNAR